MHVLIDEILTELKQETGLQKLDLERIIDSQFKILCNNIENGDTKVVNLIHLGKYLPTKYLLENRYKFRLTKEENATLKKLKKYNSRMVEPFIREIENRYIGPEKI